MGVTSLLLLVDSPRPLSDPIAVNANVNNVFKFSFPCKTIKYKAAGEKYYSISFSVLSKYFLETGWRLFNTKSERCVFLSVSGKCRELYLDAEISKWLLCFFPARLLGASSSTGLQCSAILFSANHSFTDINLGAATEIYKDWRYASTLQNVYSYLKWKCLMNNLLKYCIVYCIVALWILNFKMITFLIAHWDVNWLYCQLLASLSVYLLLSLLSRKEIIRYFIYTIYLQKCHQWFFYQNIVIG